ncbi:hypothetical protein [Poriferisphaera sp. WC338]|uniref:hypothetical protein n=1 Tax=Poriferisphaera sp. WC338 TaxID=3425129 RepID=UPI003D81AFD5
MDSFGKRCLVLIAGGLLLLSTGCTVAREKVAVINPSYSYVKAGVSLAKRSSPEDLIGTRFAQANKPAEADQTANK